MKIPSLRGAVVGALALLGVVALPSNASAYTVNFTSGEWTPAFNSQSNTATLANADESGVTVTLTAAPTSGKITLDLSDGGIGIDSKSYEDDEIEGCESLKITFTSSSPVTLTEVYLVDLYKESNNYGSGTYFEKGYYKIDGQAKQGFTADKTDIQNSGNETLAINQVVTSIVFTAPGLEGFLGKQDHDFAIAGFSFTTPSSSSVPELDGRSAFGAIGLLFVGLMVGTSRRRRLSVRPGV